MEDHLTWIKANTSSAQTIQKILEVKRIKVVNESDHKTCQQLTFCVSPAHTKCDASFLKTLVNQLNWWATRLQRIIRVFHSNSKDNQKKCQLLNDNANLKSRDLRDVDSTWQRLNTSLPVKGGIEGHSHEILSLNGFCTSVDGDHGRFFQGATCKYKQGCNSSGAGGGGWCGSDSGGHSNPSDCSWGGSGLGWIFIELNFNKDSQVTLPSTT